MRLHATVLLARADLQQPVGIDRKRHADARRTRHHGGNSAQRKTRQAAAIGHQIALPLHHVQRQGGLAVLVGGEVLRHRRWNGLVARHNALNQAAHRLNAQRQRHDVKQQQIARQVIAGQLVGLDGGAQRHDFVGVEVGQRRLAKKVAYRVPNLRHAGGAAHQHDAGHIGRLQAGIAQHFAHRLHGASGQRGGERFKLGARERLGDRASGQGHGKRRALALT